jgi:hypothetical protein
MMQGWSGAPASRPQSYSVACAEGHRLQGQRTEGYQALRCPTCGEGIFVLPRSPLPIPPAPASSARQAIAQSVEAFPEDDPLVLSDPPIASSTHEQADLEVAEAEIDWVDEIAPEVVVKTGVKPPAPVAKPRPKASPTAPNPARPTPVPAKANRPAPKPTPDRPTILIETSPTLFEWASSHRNALLVVAVLILIMGAIGMRLRRQRLEELPQIAETGQTEGMKKLDAGEFFVAKKLLRDASDAVDALGGQYEGADEIRQGALEAAIFADLAPSGIDEILEEAATGDPSKWPSKFASMYKGRSVILDPPIAEVPDPAKPGSSYKVNYPLYFGRGPKPEGRGRIDLTGFRLFELSQPKVDEQKPFGARYASIELDTITSQWVVTFEPDSGVFITHPRALEAINWPSSDPVEEDKP